MLLLSDANFAKRNGLQSYADYELDWFDLVLGDGEELPAEVTMENEVESCELWYCGFRYDSYNRSLVCPSGNWFVHPENGDTCTPANFNFSFSCMRRSGFMRPSASCDHLHGAARSH